MALMMNEKNKEIIIKIKEQKNKIFSRINKKSYWIFFIIILICGIVFHLYNTKEFREIKKATVECVGRINKVEENLYKYIDIGKNKRYMKLNNTTLSLADGSVGKVRELYTELSESDKVKYSEYLNKIYNTTLEDLETKWDSYGLTSTKKNQWIENGDDYYNKIIKKLYQDKEQEKLDKYGSVSITSKKYIITSDNYCIKGTVKNTTKNTVYFIKVKVSLLNENNEVINTDNTYAVGDEGLRTGESSTFTCYTDKIEGAKSYRVEVYEYK